MALGQRRILRRWLPRASQRFNLEPLERDDKKWEPVFVPKSRDNKNLERAFNSIKYHPALGSLFTALPMSLAVRQGRQPPMASSDA